MKDNDGEMHMLQPSKKGGVDDSIYESFFLLCFIYVMDCCNRVD